jgi:PadR family transcriptional regulator, regulatory protein PadR
MTQVVKADRDLRAFLCRLPGFLPGVDWPRRIRVIDDGLTEQSLKVLKLFLDDPHASYSGAAMMKAIGLSSGTLYPILIRLEDAGLLKSEWESAAPQLLGRPRRRLYTVTGLGQRIAREALAGLGVPATGFLRPEFAR